MEYKCAGQYVRAAAVAARGAGRAGRRGLGRQLGAVALADVRQQAAPARDHTS